MEKSWLLKPTIVLTMGALQFIALCASSRGAAGDVDLSFDPGSGINGPISAMVIQPDGKMIICGEFTTVRGLVRTNIARLNPDGSGDSSFISSVEPGLTAIALQSDGKILVTGERRITRLHANGTFDATFVSPLDSVELGDHIRVTAMEVQPDGRVLLAGGFYAEDGTNVHLGLTRLNTNGTIDSSFVPPTNLVYSCFALQPDGKIVISADDPLDDWEHSRIIRLNANGTIDSTFTNEIVLNGFADALASSIALQPDGKVLVGGRFTSVGGLERRGMARLNSNGTVDATFDPGTPGYEVIGSIALQSDGKMVVAVENFSWFIARLNSNGSEDLGFSRRYGFVSKVALQSDGRIVGVSRSVHVDGINRFELARLNSDSTVGSVV